jgi:copper chaperone CopZ
MKNIFVVIVTLFLSASLFAQNAEVKIQTSAVCEMCKETIEHDLLFEKGVKKVSLDLDTKVVTVVYNSKKTDEEKIRIAITKIGYDADTLPAILLLTQSFLIAAGRTHRSTGELRVTCFGLM